jgi:hypothetical protein
MMKTCFECGSTENIENHHVVPRSKGGKKTIPLCARCHDKVHDRYRSKITSSQLTKEGLKKAKKRGAKLGNPNPKVALTSARKAIQERKKKFDETAAIAIAEIQSTGVKSLTKIAECLNKRGEQTSRGKKWTPTAVRRILR